MKLMRLSKFDFIFIQTNYGRYMVTYKSPKTGKCWSNTLCDMELIDSIKNCEYPKQVDLKRLKRFCKLIK